MKKFAVIFAFFAVLVAPVLAQTNCKAVFPNEKLNPKQDEVKLPFVDDKDVQGYWVAVDFVKEPQSFNLQKKNFKDELFLKDLIILPGGKILNSVFSWTKGHILNPVDKTDSAYQIKQIDGETYLFFEWKSGDYTCLGMKPKYYVLRKVANIRTDDTNLPFKNDKKVIGKWKAIDFVFDTEDFTPAQKYWKGDLYLKTLTLLPKGKTPMSPAITWTKGKILDHNDKTASAYEIKKIGGKEYMFFEWKSGDYTFRGMKPAYYVLERVK